VGADGPGFMTCSLIVRCEFWHEFKSPKEFSNWWRAPMNIKVLMFAVVVTIAHGSFSLNTAFSQGPSGLEARTGTVVTYVNEDLFNAELHDALAANYQVVQVDPLAKFTVDRIPTPIMKWLSAVRGKGGGYRFIDESKGPSDTDTESSDIAALLFQIITELWNVIKELLLYSPAKNYKAEIYYKNPTDLSVTKILFKQLSQQ
jgi:hypothetical protein